jgi:mRNA-degrading endonuclease RelE of RelBE toxin-antitoxin system
MPPSERFRIVYDPSLTRHLAAIDRRYHRMIREAVDEQLTHQPATATRNRKPLGRPTDFGATWELRCGPNNRFRVFYDVDVGEGRVDILAVGVKEGNRLSIAGEEVSL